MTKEIGTSSQNYFNSGGPTILGLRVRFKLQVGNPWTNLAEIWLTYCQIVFPKNVSAIFDFFFRFPGKVFFFTGSFNDLLSLTSTAYNNRTNALDKNLRHGFLVNRSKCDLNWLLPLMFGWPPLNFTVAPTFTKSFSFLNCVNILIS